jgi:hypothetical protein
MRYAYKVWHSEQHKTTAKRDAGRVLDDDEIRICHESLEPLVALSYKLEPHIEASVVLMRPAKRGAIIFLDFDGSEEQADQSIAGCLTRINRLDVDLCFVAEPLPQTPVHPAVSSQVMGAGSSL